jgi:hypothetical protein
VKSVSNSVIRGKIAARIAGRATAMAKTPGKATVLWIEADPVFGGSRSQVQFPVELAPFFSLPHGPHIGDHVQRGVIFGGVIFSGKKMDFHHNDVWRLNLPTARQGLGGYQGKILVFKKSSKKGQLYLWIADRKTPALRRLRRATRTHGRLGSKTRDDGKKREFGYF